MNDDRQRSAGGESAGGSRSPVTRRGALAVVGTTLLAGCSLPNVLGSDPVELDGHDLARVVDRDHPTIPSPLPVEVSRDHVAHARERAHSLLASVPLPLSPEELPNGTMREALHREAEHARDHLTDAIEAPGTRERLDVLAHARGPARSIAASWAYTQDELTISDVTEERETVAQAAREFEKRREYLGDDPVRAVIVHDVVEQWTNDASDDARSVWEGEDATALAIGEGAADVAEARASLSDARHVYEQYAASLSDRQSIRDRLEAARDSLSETVDDRLTDLPDEDVEIQDQLDADTEGTVAGRAIESLHHGVYDRYEYAYADGLAGAVLGQVARLARIGAFETLRDRIEAGEQRTVTSVEDVEAMREAAVTAVDGARSGSADDRLMRTVLADLSEWFDYLARDLTEVGDSVERRRLIRDLAAYVEIETSAAATPAAVDEGLAALDAD